jgi:serine/threonine protein kinase
MTVADFFKRYHFDPEKDKIGEGGFGSVYKAQDLVTGKAVAIKVSSVQNHNFSLAREVELSNEIEGHSNVLSYIDTVREQTRVAAMDYAVMKYYEYGSLEALLRSRPNLNLDEKKQLIEGIFQGIKHLHKEHIIHRDLKSGNILIDYVNGKWIPKIADFGLSKLLGSQDANTISRNSAIGMTMAYAAPEQILGTKIKQNVDIWAIGVIMYRILTNSLPFSSNMTTGESANMAIAKKITDNVLPYDLNKLPEPFQKTIRACWVYNNDERVQNMDALLKIYNDSTDKSIAKPEPKPIVFKSPVFIDKVKKIIATKAPKFDYRWLGLLLLLIPLVYVFCGKEEAKGVVPPFVRPVPDPPKSEDTILTPIPPDNTSKHKQPTPKLPIKPLPEPPPKNTVNTVPDEPKPPIPEPLPPPKRSCGLYIGYGSMMPKYKNGEATGLSEKFKNIDNCRMKKIIIVLHINFEGAIDSYLINNCDKCDGKRNTIMEIIEGIKREHNGNPFEPGRNTDGKTDCFSIPVQLKRN